MTETTAYEVYKLVKKKKDDLQQARKSRQIHVANILHRYCRFVFIGSRKDIVHSNYDVGL